MIQVKQEIITKVKESVPAKNRLAYALGCSARSIDRYLEDNNILLTTADAVNAISKELHIPESEILTEA